MTDSFNLFDALNYVRARWHIIAAVVVAEDCRRYILQRRTPC